MSPKHAELHGYMGWPVFPVTGDTSRELEKDLEGSGIK